MSFTIIRKNITTLIKNETFQSYVTDEKKQEQNETLERVVKEKIEPMLEEAMQKYLGITISEVEKDITSKLEHERLIGFLIRVDLPFKEAKKLFKKEFLERTIQTHYGNISEVADLVGLDRRSIHRDIKSLKVDVKRLRERFYRQGYFEKEAVDGMIRKTLEGYKQIIRPEKLEQMYGHVPQLSESIIKVLPLQMGWKQAEEEFEKVYIKRVLDDNRWNITLTARRIKVRYETLLRKIKKLGLK